MYHHTLFKQRCGGMNSTVNLYPPLLPVSLFVYMYICMQYIHERCVHVPVYPPQLPIYTSEHLSIYPLIFPCTRLSIHIRLSTLPQLPLCFPPTSQVWQDAPWPRGAHGPRGPAPALRRGRRRAWGRPPGGARSRGPELRSLGGQAGGGPGAGSYRPALGGGLRRAVGGDVCIHIYTYIVYARTVYVLLYGM